MVDQGGLKSHEQWAKMSPSWLSRLVRCTYSYEFNIAPLTLNLPRLV